MKKSFLILCSGFVAMFAVSCAPSTPAYRISQRPLVFEKLSEKEKELVKRGEIAKGMDKSAVALAWGSPSSTVEGLKGNKRTERWEYNGSKPVITNNFFGGYRYGSYGPYRYSGIGAGFGPEVTYVPYRKGIVWFADDRVEEWERRQ
jgi:hypothetical protein